MSKNALIFPSMLNYRVSVNDSMSLRMILAQRVPIDELVWYHLFNFRTPRRLGGGQLQMNIRSVKYDDRGPYLVFFPVNNPTRRVLLQGLTMVVVRKCIAGKYGRRCELSCPPCENGAICDDVSGSCICPPGFKGELCEIACGPNKFGAKCQHVCSTDPEEGCKGKMFCMAEPYGCSCATGLSGIICTLPCADSKYGEGCLLDCHCQLDKCDPYTGACLHGCAEGWTGPNCQKPCPVNRFGLNCNRTCGFCKAGENCDRFTGFCPRFNENSVNSAESLNVTVCEFGYNPPRCIERCVNGSWGEDCRNDCHCWNRTACDVRTGACKARDECDTGWVGDQCDMACSAGLYGDKCALECGKCANNSGCHHITGECDTSTCETGYQPKMCNTLCGEGYFGDNCSSLCNCANGTSCHPVTGKCSGYCQPGWTGISCWEACPTGTYGLNCSQECGNCKETVEGPICHLAFGTCNGGCKRTWTGPRCLEGVLCAQKPCLNGGSCEQSDDIYICYCPATYTGPHCEEIIPVCDSAPCRNNGTCIGHVTDPFLFNCTCVANYTGNLCQVEPVSEADTSDIDDDEKAFSLTLLLTCLFLFALLSAGLFVVKFWSKKKRKSVAPFNDQLEKSSATSDTEIEGEQEPEIVQPVEPQNTMKPELPHTSTEIRFGDTTIPVKSSETVAHVTPMDHTLDFSSKPSPSKDEDSVTKFQEEVLKKVDLKSTLILPEPILVSEPPAPPIGPSDDDEKSNIRKSVLPTPRARFDSQTLSRLSEISLHNFYSPRRTLNRDSIISSGGCALCDSRRTPVVGVPTRDSKLLITESRSAEEDFEMEGRRGSIFGRNNVIREVPSVETKT